MPPNGRSIAAQLLADFKAKYPDRYRELYEVQ